MRIAVWHNLPSGGGKRAMHQQVQGLVRRGHHIEAWCPSTADKNYQPLNAVVKEHVLPFEWEPRPVKGKFSALMSSYHQVADKLEAMERHCMQTAEEVAEGRFDVLLAHPCYMLGVPSIARYVRIPSVIYLHEPFRRLYEALPKLPWIAQPSAKTVGWSLSHVRNLMLDQVKVHGLRVQAREELLNAEAFDLILVNSYFSRESVLRAYGLDSKVCYLGIDSEKFVDQGKPRENTVVGIGAFIPEKNIRLVIHAVALLPEPRPKLVWIGNFGSFDELLVEARSLGVVLEPRQYIDDDEMVDILNRSRVMAYAPRLEPFGYAPLEANACGLPVVAVAEGGVRETMVDGVNGLLVEPSAHAMASGIAQLLSQPELASRIGRQARDLVERRWGLWASIDRIEARLREVLGETRIHSVGLITREAARS